MGQNGGKALDLDDPVVDAEIFERGIKRQFGDLKKNFRDVVDNLRTNDYKTFVKVNEPKAKQNEKKGAYSKLELELQKLKRQIDKANDAKALFNDFFADVKGQKSSSPVRKQGLRNHTDAKLGRKGSPTKNGDQYYDDEEEELEDNEYDHLGDKKIDYNDLYRKSINLHSRKDQEQGRIMKERQEEDDEALELSNRGVLLSGGISKTQA